LLGALLVDPAAIATIATLVASADFFRARNARVFEAILEIYHRSDIVDFVSVAAELERNGQLEIIGGTAYLASLVNQAPSSLHVETYAREVERTALMRRLIGASDRIREIGMANPSDVDEALDRSQSLLFELAQRRISRQFTPLRDALHEFFNRLDELQNRRGDLIGRPTGFIELDRITGGLHDGDLIILAARPSMGKSALGFNIARNCAAASHGVLVFSLEMSIEQIVQRMICSEASVDAQRLRQGYIDDSEWRRISEAFGTLSESPIWFDDTPALSTTEMRMKARRLKSEHDIQLVVVDYIQLMRGRGLENRVQEVGEISRSLKELARDLKVPVLALSQLSRAVESRQDHRPVLSDLRESGSIEQDADLVMFIHREEMYDRQTEKKNLAEIIIAKHRNGPVGGFNLRFFPNQVKFGDLESYRQPN